MRRAALAAVTRCCGGVGAGAPAAAAFFATCSTMKRGGRKAGGRSGGSAGAGSGAPVFPTFPGFAGLAGLPDFPQFPAFPGLGVGAAGMSTLGASVSSGAAPARRGVGGSGAAPSVPLSILSWNLLAPCYFRLHSTEYGKKVKVEAQLRTAWERRLAQQLALLREAGADVLALQEVWFKPDVFATIRSALGSDYAMHCARRTEGRDDGVALLVRRSRWSVSEARGVEFRGAGNRVMMMAFLESTAPPATPGAPPASAIVATTHLTFPSAPADEHARLLQAQCASSELLAFAAEMQARQGRSTVISALASAALQRFGSPKPSHSGRVGAGAGAGAAGMDEESASSGSDDSDSNSDAGPLEVEVPLPQGFRMGGGAGSGGGGGASSMSVAAIAAAAVVSGGSAFAPASGGTGAGSGSASAAKPRKRGGGKAAAAAAVPEPAAVPDPVPVPAPAIPLLLVGDFNHYDDAAMRYFKAAGWADVYKALHGRSGGTCAPLGSGAAAGAGAADCGPHRGIITHATHSGLQLGVDYVLAYAPALAGADAGAGPAAGAGSAASSGGAGASAGAGTPSSSAKTALLHPHLRAWAAELLPDGTSPDVPMPRPLVQRVPAPWLHKGAVEQGALAALSSSPREASAASAHTAPGTAGLVGAPHHMEGAGGMALESGGPRAGAAAEPSEAGDDDSDGEDDEEGPFLACPAPAVAGTAAAAGMGSSRTAALLSATGSFRDALPSGSASAPAGGRAAAEGGSGAGSSDKDVAFATAAAMIRAGAAAAHASTARIAADAAVAEAAMAVAAPVPPVFHPIRPMAALTFADWCSLSDHRPLLARFDVLPEPPDEG